MPVALVVMISVPFVMVLRAIVVMMTITVASRLRSALRWRSMGRTRFTVVRRIAGWHAGVGWFWQLAVRHNIRSVNLFICTFRIN